LKRKFRLTSPTDFKRVRRYGKSYAHPLIVLVALPNEETQSRFGVAVGRTLGNAVKRNRVKRTLREALRPMLPAITPGWDVILIARRPIAEATFDEVQQAVIQLLKRVGLLEENGLLL